MPHRIRIWDLPTRLFHWLLALCVIGLVASAKLGLMDWHFRLGYAMLTLLVFRLLWGLVGGRWSRFSSFLYAPGSLWRYLRGRGEPTHAIGHSPTGALSVFALLILLLVQVASGLISDDEIASAGPLTHLVPGTWVSLATWYHRAIGQWALIALVLLHIAAILWYLWGRKQNLIQPMISGDKLLSQAAEPARDDFGSRLLAGVLLLLCAGAVALLLRYAGP
ncbi:MAG: cytochrome b/b6 domain-containing protein [Hylemonella sp.]|uniref:cytochrome b/b6 domain-containing protein n=1 Tax=Hylemonella sp. TaxID=2066020 RepID=UPI0022BFE7E0|nr:cytochrome b/b6 domain-containing protein [Hylemonella sp.]MCZ8253391.1 cytochrome b/b6 domain-containing protein [Hylemonella sp.]